MLTALVLLATLGAPLCIGQQCWSDDAIVLPGDTTWEYVSTPTPTPDAITRLERVLIQQRGVLAQQGAAIEQARRDHQAATAALNAIAAALYPAPTDTETQIPTPTATSTEAPATAAPE
jgi:hypothetical protein